MLCEFSQDPGDDGMVAEIMKERPNQPIKLRLQPALLHGNGQYRGWPDVRWLVQCDSVDEVFATRDALRTFFETLSRQGPRAVVAALKGAKKRR